MPDGPEYELAAVAEQCGVSEVDLRALYRWFAREPKSVTLFCQGVNQSNQGTDKANSIINAHLLTGRVGKPGASPFSMTGQPNAMGGERWAAWPRNWRRTWALLRGIVNGYNASGAHHVSLASLGLRRSTCLKPYGRRRSALCG